MAVRENLEKILAGLPPQVLLVAVSKTKPREMIMDAYEAGQRDFGENYVQELTDKHEQLPKDIRWHFIGHLQSNKVKYIAPFVHLIHGVDSLKLLQEINKQAEKNKRVIDCLLQIYIASEETKFGLSFEECESLFSSDAFANLKHVKVRGFMGMASNTEDMAQVAKEFSALKSFFDHISNNVLDLSVLSMGMSGDYKLAIECGSTMIRIGSTIFGERG
jgi:pyridoxal phosphate enzyme (YggS family)